MKNPKSRNKQEAKASGVSWTDRAWDEYLSWQKDDQNMVKSINQLNEECRRHPFEGTGKPKALRGGMSGYWSRRGIGWLAYMRAPDGNIFGMMQADTNAA